MEEISISEKNAKIRSNCNYIGFLGNSMESHIDGAKPIELIKYAMNRDKPEWFSNDFECIENDAKRIDDIISEKLNRPEDATVVSRVMELNDKGVELFREFTKAYQAFMVEYRETFEGIRAEIDDIVREGQGLIVNE